MNNDGKTPEIRFRGFDGEWENRKLGNIASEILAGGDVDKSLLLEKGAYPVIANALTNDGIIGYYSQHYRVTAPAVTVTGRGDVGHAKARKVNFTPVVRLLTIKSNQDIFFLENVINTLPIVIESTGVPQLTAPQIKKYEITFPSSLEEQQQIGSFFERLDALIAHYRRRRDKLSSVKKSLLEKMFPRDGAKVPEIRFEGFGGDWETKKLKELASFSKGSGYSKNDLKESGTPIILYGRLYTQYETVITNVDTYANKTANAVYSQGGEVLVPASGETAEDISIASVVMKSGVLLGGDLNVILPSNNVDSTFLAISITSGAPHYQMSKMAQGKTIVHLHKSNLEEIDFIFPVLAEQRQIGAFFQEIDAALAHSARLLAKLQGVKKSFLSKLFVSSSSGAEV